MNKNIILTLATIFILAGCSEPEEKNQPIGSAEINTSAPAVDINTSENVVKQELRLNLEKGKTYIQNSNSSTTIYQTLGAQQVSTSITVIAKTSFKVLELNNDLFTMEVRYERMIMSMVTPQTIKQYSTENPMPNDFISMAMQNLKNKPFKVVMNRVGKVVEIKGVAALFEDAGKKFKGDNAAKQAILNQLIQSFGEKSFVSNIEKSSAIFPTEPVAQGQRWTITGSLGIGISSDYTSVFELKAINDSLCDLKGNAKVSTKNKDAFVEINGIMMKYEMDGTMTSDIKIDRKTGWIKRAQFIQNLSGNATIKAGAIMPEELTVPMTSSSDVTITDQ